MAFTRKRLEALGLDAEKIDIIMGDHVEVVDGIKADRDKYKAEADKLTEVQASLDKAKKQVEDLQKAGGDAAKVQAEYDAYKKKVEAEKANAGKREALHKLLGECGIKRDSFLRAVEKDFDVSALELDEKGQIKTADDIRARVDKDFADFKSTTDDRGTGGKNPPTGGNDGGGNKGQGGASGNLTGLAAALAEQYNQKG